LAGSPTTELTNLHGGARGGGLTQLCVHLMTRFIRCFITAAVALLGTLDFVVAQTSPALSISDQTITGMKGTPMQAQIVATGASAYYVIGNLMPYGLVLNQSTGAVTGTPTISGNTNVQIKVTDTSGHSATANLAVNIAANSDPTPPTISDQTFTGTVGTVLNAQIAATNANEYHVVTGVLPSGLNLNTASGVVNGIPQTAGTTTVTLQVKNGAGTAATANITFNIPGPTIKDQTLTGIEGRPVQYQIVASGASAYYVTGNLMPYGLQLNQSTGAVTGTPTMSGNTNVQIKVTDASGNSALANLNVSIAPATNSNGPTISDQTLTGTDGTPEQYQIVASGATAYYVIGNLMPYGMQLNQSTGAVTGTPTMSGNTNVQIKVTDASGNSAFANLHVSIAPATNPNGPTISDQSFTGKVGTSMSAQIAATGTTEFQVVSGSLPSGFTLNRTTGVVNGTPQAAGTTTATVQVKDANGRTAQANVTFSIAASSDPNPPTIQNQTINGTIDVPLTAQIKATNATSYNIPVGQLVPGLRLDTATGILSGAPTVAGTTSVTVEVTNALGSRASATVTFAIAGTNTQAVITNVSVDPGDHTFGVSLSVTYTRPVSVTLQPVIHLDIGGQPVVARFGYPDLSGSDRKVLHFSYQVESGVHGPLTIHSPVDLLNGAIASDDGMAASLSFTPPDTSGVFVGFAPATPGQPTKTAQSITLTPPRDGLTIGQPVTLNGTSSVGLPITYTLQGGNATLKDGVLTPLSTETIVVGASNPGNDTYYAASTQVNFGNPRPVAQQTVIAGATIQATTDKPLTLTATDTSTATRSVKYAVVSGPATMNGDTVTFTGTGNVTVAVVTQQDATDQTTQTMTVAAHPVARLVNISSRVHVAGNGDGATVGFVVTGTAPKQILVRAVGDSLAGFGVNDGLSNPNLTLYGANSTVLATNHGWNNDPQVAAAATAVGAFPLVPGKTDAALLLTLEPGLYSAQVTSSNSGSALLEVYDVAANVAVPTKQLVNISTRAHLDAANVVFQGFVISGDQPKRVLIRAVGSTLSGFGVTDAVADPAIKLYSGDTIVAADDDWETAGTASGNVSLGTASDIVGAGKAVGAFPLPTGSKDAALLVTLQPGLYSAVVSAPNAQSGTVLVEAYEVP
jgi:hypothetical protein